jgi:hypothetical protein
LRGQIQLRYRFGRDRHLRLRGHGFLARPVYVKWDLVFGRERMFAVGGMNRAAPLTRKKAPASEGGLYKDGRSPIMMRLRKCLPNAPIGTWRQIA